MIAEHRSMEIRNTGVYIEMRTTYFWQHLLQLLESSRSQWPRSLRHEKSSPARTLGSWIGIPLKAWMSVCVYSVSVRQRPATA
jgi:hypothetical protein